jgi:hypothetical protein
MDAADEVVERAVAAARGVELPEGPGAAVKGRVLAMGGGRRVRMRGRAWRWAVAALVVMTVGGMWGWLGSGRVGGGGGSGVAFAEVVERLREVKTVTYRQATSQPGMAGLVVTRETVEMGGKYSRTEIVAADGKGGERVRGIAIYNQGRMLNLDMEAKRGTLMDYTNGGRDAPHRLAGTHTLEELRTVATQIAKPLGTREQGGKMLVGYEVERAAGWEGMRVTYEVWVDAATKLPVRVVETQRQELDGMMIGGVPTQPAKPYVVVRTLTEIRFDVLAGEEAFSLRAPEGFVVRE